MIGSVSAAKQNAFLILKWKSEDLFYVNILQSYTPRASSLLAFLSLSLLSSHHLRRATTALLFTTAIWNEVQTFDVWSYRWLRLSHKKREKHEHSQSFWIGFPTVSSSIKHRLLTSSRDASDVYRCTFIVRPEDEVRYVNSLFIENEYVLRWNCRKETKKIQFVLSKRSEAKGGKGKIESLQLFLTDHAQLNLYVPCWALHEVSSASIQPVVLALHVRYNKWWQ